MADSDEWTSDANKAITICLLRSAYPDAVSIGKFHPRFTYPIFGDAQTIWGYQGLNVQLRFASHNLLPNVKVRWKEKHATVGEAAPLDIKRTLRDWMPEEAFGCSYEYELFAQGNIVDYKFRPPGELLTKYGAEERTFEVWHASLKDQRMQELFRRMQIFTPLFIEGGTYVSLDDPDWTLDRWTVFMLYERLFEPPLPSAPYYSFMGYSTVYRFPFLIPKKPPSENEEAMKDPSDTPFEIPSPAPPITKFPCRQRIAQFVILPPYQRLGHGSSFFSALFSYFLADPNVHEVTVEDPNEAFDDLRDFCDLTRLRKKEAFTKLQIEHKAEIPKVKGAKLSTANILPVDFLEDFRRQNKVAPRQFARLVEMQLLSLTPKEILQLSPTERERVGRSPQSSNEEKAYRLWRLIVKQRIYKRSKDLLAQLDRVEKVQKLEETLNNLEADYLRILQSAEGSEDENEILPLTEEEKAEEKEEESSAEDTAEEEIREEQRLNERQWYEQELLALQRAGKPPSVAPDDSQQPETERQRQLREELNARMREELLEWKERSERYREEELEREVAEAQQQDERELSNNNQPDPKIPSQPAQSPTSPKAQDQQELPIRGRKKRPAPAASHDEDADVDDADEEPTDDDELYETGVEDWDLQTGPDGKPIPGGTGIGPASASATVTEGEREKDKGNHHVSKKIKFSSNLGSGG